MTELATHFVRLLGQTTVALAVAVIAVSLILRGLRVTSPTTHRVGWTLALLVGWWFVRLSAQVPWYEPAAKPAPQDFANPTSRVEPSQFTGTWTEAPTAQIAADAPQVAESLPADENALIEIGPGGDAATYLEPATLPAQASDLAVDVTSSPVEPELPIIVAGGKLRDSDTPTAATAPTATAATTFHFWPLIALATWAIGVCVAVMAWAFGYVRFVRRLPPALPAPESWTDQWQALQTAHKIQRQIPLRVTEQLGPMLCRLPRGYALLVPEALWRDLDSSQRAAVLRHELAHYQRRDVWKSLAVRVLALPHWFNPLAWAAVRHFDDAAEWACDHAAAADEPATKYARTLVRLGESAARHAAYSPAVRGASLRGRVRRLLNAASDRDSLSKKLLLSAMALVAVVGLAVRVELVAKERVEAPISESTDQSTADAAKAEDGAATLPPSVYGTVESEPLSEADAELVEAAERGFNAASAAYANDTITLDEVCAWSLRWLSAIEVTTKSPPDKVAATRANLERFQALRLQIKALFDVGARGGEAEKLAMTDYYVADAKRRLAIAQREVEKSKHKLLEARDKAVDQENLLRQSKSRADQVRQSEARVEAARQKLDDLSKAHFAINFTKNPTLYEAARVQRVEAEHEFDAAVRDAISARRAFSGASKNRTEPPYSAADQAKIQQLQEQLTQANARRVDTQQKIALLQDDIAKAEQELATAKAGAAEVLAQLERPDSKIPALQNEIASHNQAIFELQNKITDSESEDATKLQVEERARLQSKLDAKKDEVRAASRQLTELSTILAAEATLVLLKQQYAQLWTEENTYYKQMHEVRIQLYELGVVLAESGNAATKSEARPGQSPEQDGDPAGDANKEKTQTTSGQTLADERFAQLVAIEARRSETRARLRAATKLLNKADRSGDEQRTAEAERALAEVRAELSAIEAALQAPDDLLPRAERANENRIRDEVDQADAQVEAATERLDQAMQAKHAADELGDAQTIGERTEDLAQANQALAVARRQQRQFRQWLESMLKQRAQSQVERTVATLPSSIRDRVLGDDKIQQLKEKIAEHDKTAAKYTQEIVDGKGKQVSRNVYQSLKKLLAEKASLEKQFEERVKTLVERYRNPADIGPTLSDARETAANDPNTLNKAIQPITKGDPQKLQSELKTAKDKLAQWQREYDDAKVALETLQQQKRNYVPAIDERISNDAKVRKLEADIAEYDVAIAKLEKQVKPGKVHHALENLNKERAGLQEHLDERMKQLEEKYIEPKRLTEVREADLKIAVAKTKVDELDAQIEHQNALIEVIQASLKTSGDNSGERKLNLRYNGRSFDQWRDELETELSPDRLIEACEAFAAFARSGYGAEAAARIVEVGGNYTSPAASDHTVSNLTQTTTKLLCALRLEAVLPALTSALDSPQLKQRQHAAYILSLRGGESATIPALLVAARDSGQRVSELAYQGLRKADLNDKAVLGAFLSPLNDEDQSIQIATMLAIARVCGESMTLTNPEWKKVASILTERLKSPNAAMSLAAAHALASFGAESAPAVPMILPWLKEFGSPRQMAALRLVSVLGPLAEQAIPALIEAADSGKPGEKEAIRCLGLMGPKSAEAVPRLMAIANSRSDIGVAAIRALGQMGPAAKEAIPLLEKFATRDEWPHLKEDSQLVLPYIRGEKSLGAHASESPAKPEPEPEKAPVNTNYK